MLDFRFDNAFVRELPGDTDPTLRPRAVYGALYSPVLPTPVAAPRLLAYSADTAALLDLDRVDLESAAFAEVFAGNRLLPGMQPYAANYGGHQFGHWAGQLGDGRALSLGEIVNRAGQRWELQLKGAGPTPYSRSADGRAVLRSSIREFLCSEAMHHLGVPTTRALSLVASGETVVRDMFYDGNPRAEPGAVICRVAPSFIRFGSFELPTSRGDTVLLKQLVDFTIRRDFPELAQVHPAGSEALYAAWFAEVCARTAVLIAHWMRVGFVHGVMNTDNLSILGLTIDYGPYGWIDNFDPDWTPNTTDREHRRYRYGQQAQVAYWNLGCLAGAVAPLFATPDALHAGLQSYADTFVQADRANIAAKLGLRECRDDDVGRMQSLYSLLHSAEVDMTLFFRGLATADTAADAIDSLRIAFYDDEKFAAARPAFCAWLQDYTQRLAQDVLPVEQRRDRMNAANPRYVLRNYLAQLAIDRAENGDLSGVHDLLEVLRRPYQDQPGRDAFAQRRPDWARTRAGCSMLSCSS
ncbi:MAG: YdiU family protein [Rhodanobacteraceae bacterium]|nr:YdiU family protein [Rhodanobacteraceae bacterium]